MYQGGVKKLFLICLSGCPNVVPYTTLLKLVGTLYYFAVGLQCPLHRTVDPLHFELGTHLVSYIADILT